MRLKSLIRMIHKPFQYTKLKNFVACRVCVWEQNKIWTAGPEAVAEGAVCPNVVCLVLSFSSRRSIRRALGTRSSKSHPLPPRPSQTLHWGWQIYCCPFRALMTSCLHKEMNLHLSFPPRAWIFPLLQYPEISWSKTASSTAMDCIW